mgnify:FL=1
MDKWYYYKEAVRQFIEKTAERWMETQLKQKGLEQYFLAKIDDMQKTIVRFVLDPKGDTYNYQVIYMSDLAGSTDHDFEFGEVAFTEDTRQYMDGKRAAEYGNKKEELEVEWEKFVSNGFYRVGKDFMRMV